MDRPQLIQGRLVRTAEVAAIRDWLRANPESNRTRLSRELCLAWNWRNGTGRLKDMACRSLLLKLEAQGQIELPPRRTASVNGLRNRRDVLTDHDPSPVHCSLGSLQLVDLKPVVEGSPEAGLFRFLLQRYHYLGHRNCVGENLKYLARASDGRVLACLLFGSAAWKMAARDSWIRWNPEERRRHLFLLTNHTRFLIPGWVRVPHLASHLLGLAAARVSADWQQKYGHPIYLLESFVQQGRFAGTCYRAAGWMCVGTTTGRTRNDDGRQLRQPVKAVYLKALTDDLPRRLRS